MSFNLTPYTSAVKVQAMAKNIEMSQGRTSTVTSAEINYYLGWTDDVINSKLSSMYYTPLTQITRNGVTGYPHPIEYIATNLAAGFLVESIYQRIDPQISDSGKVHKDNAMMELDELYKGALGGSRFLEGQIRKAGNHFVDPSIIPVEPPQNRTY